MTNISINGILPNLAVKADHLPARSETGIGALMPWADRLWFVTYVAHKAPTGNGTGLFWVDDDMQLHKHPASVVGTYANRMIHPETNQLVLGPHLIDTDGNVRTVEELIDIRVAATAEHLTDPENRCYCLGMEGELMEVDMHEAKAEMIANLTDILQVPYQPHFKGAYTHQGRLVVANNTYSDRDFDHPDKAAGRLAEWDGTTWTILDKAQYNEVMGRKSIGNAIFASGADNASAILQVCVEGEWRTYRLPKATHTQDHTVTTEWPRIREIESERWMMNASGMFYELPAMHYGKSVWGLRPVSTHLRIIPDYCSWNGFLVLAGDQTTPIWDKNRYVGQPQSNLWFGKTDDLWNFGKPTGWGGPWWKEAITGGKPSDPFLMTSFEHKCLHIRQDRGKATAFDIEVDFLGDGNWDRLETLEVPASGYAHKVLPDGFSAHWVRLVPAESCNGSAQFVYT